MGNEILSKNSVLTACMLITSNFTKNIKLKSLKISSKTKMKYSKIEHNQ